MYKPVDVINVFIWGQHVGALARSPQIGYYVFAYTSSFVKTGIQLSPRHMPLTSDSYVFAYLPELTYKRLPAMIADSLPDKFGNDLISSYMESHGISLSQITILDRLAYMSKRAMGALEFKPTRGATPSISHTAIDIAKLVETSRKTVHGKLGGYDTTAVALKQIIQIGTSAGGARAKAVVAFNPVTNEIRAGQFDVEDGFEHWLLKFDGLGPDKGLGKTEHHGRIEYSYYQMAEMAGIKMSPCRLLEENGRAHFMTKRFDRTGNQKHHVQTLCAMAHMDFKQMNTYDYSQVFTLLDELNLGYSAKEEVFRRMCFNVMAANCDDHTKNMAFILKQGEAWQLAPAYDVTFAFDSSSRWTYQHFMSVSGTFKNINTDHLQAVAQRFAIGTGPRVLNQVRDAVALWPETARANNVSETEILEVSRHHRLLYCP
ncbi:MAG: type II toxin-antitoxin system HipA family toxin [Deltaproteobacteria bacterium]